MAKKHEKIQTKLGKAALIVGFVAMILFILGLILLFVGAGVENEPLTQAGIVIAVISGAVMVGSLYVRNDAEAKVCGYCGKSMKGASYSYEEVSTSVTESGNTAQQKVEIEIRAVCPHCGETKVIRKAFKRSLTSGKLESFDYKIRNWCRRKFE